MCPMCPCDFVICQCFSLFKTRYVIVEYNAMPVKGYLLTLIRTVHVTADSKFLKFDESNIMACDLDFSQCR